MVRTGTFWSVDQPGHSRLRSADLYQLHVPCTKTNLGDRSFSVNGPVVWNSLQVDLRTPDNLLDAFTWQCQNALI